MTERYGRLQRGDDILRVPSVDSIQGVPEPATWLILLIGLVSTGKVIIVRRRYGRLCVDPSNKTHDTNKCEELMSD